MSVEIKMPALGESVTEGTVTTWLKSVGDTVELDEPILEVSTDKVDTEVPSPAAGVLEQILVQEDEEVSVGTVLGLIGDGSGAAAPAAPAAAAAPAAPAPAAAPSAPSAPAPAAATPEPAAPAAPAPSAGADDGVAVTMPALGESVTEGTVTTWLKAEGDTVEQDEPILEVSTDKVDTEVPAPASGVLQRIVVGEDETVSVGTVLAYIGDGSAPAPAPAAPAAPVAAAPAPAAPAPVAPPAPATPVTPPAPAAPAPVAAPAAPAAPAPVATGAEPGGYVTPIVRKLARENDIDLASLKGTGVGGRIRRQDVEDAIKAAEEAKRAAEAAKAAPAPAAAPAAAKSKPSAEADQLRGTTQKMSRMRQVISKRMVESLQVAAQLTTVVEADVTKIFALRAAKKNEFQEKTGTKLTFLPFFVKAATDTLK